MIATPPNRITHPELIDAPEEIATLFRAWRAAPIGERAGAHWDLVQAMYGRRGSWMTCGEWIFWMRGDDRVVVAPRRR
jgi:hypothetical protein